MITKLKALRQHQGFMRYFTNTSWLMGEKALRMGVDLFVGVADAINRDLESRGIAK